MRTKVYFVRLIEIDEFKTREEARLLSFKGMEDAAAVTRYLIDKDIQAIYSSPYRRAYDTLQKLSELTELPIRTVDAFRAHTTGKDIRNIQYHIQRQWADFDYKAEGGESLRETQTRCIEGLKLVLEDSRGKDIVIGTHGIPLSTIIHYYQPNFSFEDYLRIADKMPFIASFRFDAFRCESVNNVDLFV